MIEGALERAFVKWVKSVGGEAIKGPAYQYKGIPDRIAIIPYAGTIYVEFKASTLCDLEPLQKYWRQRLLKSDYNRYFVVDNKESLEYTIGRCKLLMKVGEAQAHVIKNVYSEDSYTSKDFKRRGQLYIVNNEDRLLSNSPIGECIQICYNDKLERGDLFFNLTDNVVCIIKEVINNPHDGSCVYVYELYYQYKNQTSAAPIKFIL